MEPETLRIIVIALLVLKFIALCYIGHWICTNIFGIGTEFTLISETFSNIRKSIAIKKHKRKEEYKLLHPEKFYMTNEEFEKKLKGEIQ